MDQRSITDIGTLQGKLLCFGGVYSNFQSLQKLMQIAKEENIQPSNIICTGDVVAYCAQPEETVQAIMNWGVHCIAGNVEIQLADDAEDCGCDFASGGRCDTFSKNWFPFSKSKLSSDSIQWMKKLPDFIRFSYSGLNGLVVHGSFHETAEYIFQSTDWESKKANFDEANVELVIAGHCGLPFSQKKEQKYWLNPGVIGMPANDGGSNVWYMIIEEDGVGDLKINQLSYEYDHNITAALMLENGLPDTYANTLKTGIWDNCEILPEAETKLQGKRLVFI